MINEPCSTAWLKRSERIPFDEKELVRDAGRKVKEEEPNQTNQKPNCPQTLPESVALKDTQGELCLPSVPFRLKVNGQTSNMKGRGGGNKLENKSGDQVEIVNEVRMKGWAVLSQCRTDPPAQAQVCLETRRALCWALTEPSVAMHGVGGGGR